MRNGRGDLFLVAGLLAIAGLAEAQPPEQHPQPSVSVPPALARVLTDYEAAWRKKDAAALAALFTEDGFVLSTGHPARRSSGTTREEAVLSRFARSRSRRTERWAIS
jgi:hypothetical protein